VVTTDGRTSCRLRTIVIVCRNTHRHSIIGLVLLDTHAQERVF
jgi:hypothetical protein